VVVGMAVLNNAAQQGAHRQADHETYNQPESLSHALPISSDFFSFLVQKLRDFQKNRTIGGLSGHINPLRGLKRSPLHVVSQTQH
jgi:hypothetical protein